MTSAQGSVHPTVVYRLMQRAFVGTGQKDVGTVRGAVQGMFTAALTASDGSARHSAAVTIASRHKLLRLVCPSQVRRAMIPLCPVTLQAKSWIIL